MRYSFKKEGVIIGFVRVLWLLIGKQLVFLVLILVFGKTTYANLLDASDGVLWDNTTNKYWFQDLTHFSNMTYDEQVNEIVAINNAPQFNNILWEDWHMASYLEVSDLFYGNFNNNTFSLNGFPGFFTPTSSNAWGGRADHGYFGTHIDPWIRFDGYDFGVPQWSWDVGGSQGLGDNEKYDFIGAWVVADGKNPYPVPEPSTLFFMSTGIAIITGLRRKKKL